MARGEVKVRLAVDGKPLADGLKAAEQQFAGFVNGLTNKAGAAGTALAALGPAGAAAAIGIGVMATAGAAVAAALADATAKAVEYGGTVADASAKTGAAVEGLQRLKYGAGLAGVSFEGMTKALVGMEKQLVKAPESFAKLGLEADKLRRMDPASALVKVGDALKRIEDPSLRAAAAMATLGKGGVEALPALLTNLDAAGDKAEQLGLVLSESTITGLDATGDAADSLVAAFDGVLFNMGAAIGSTPGLSNAIEQLALAFGNLSKFVQENQGTLQQVIQLGLAPIAGVTVGAVQVIGSLASGFRILAQEARGFLGMAPDLRGILSFVGGIAGQGAMSAFRTVNAYGTSLMGQGGAARAGIAAPVNPLRPDFGGGSSGPRPMHMPRFNGGGSWSSDFMSGSPLMVTDPIMKLSMTGGGQAGAAFAAYSSGASAAQVAIARLNNELGKMGDNTASLGDIARGFDNIATIAYELPGLFTAWGAAADSALVEMADTIAGIAQGMANLAAGLASGNIGQQIGSVLQILSSVGNALQSGNAGTRAVGGFAVGGPIGALAGAFDVFGLAARRARAELEAFKDSLKDIEQRGLAAGLDVSGIAKARSEKQAGKAAAGIELALTRHGDQARAATEAQAALNDAMERYGFTAEEMGAAFQQQNLDEQAMDLVQVYKLLEAGGASVALIQERMAPDLNEYVAAALKAGATVPEAMKPILEQMIAQGLLLDENGNAYKSAEEAGITFAKSTSEAMAETIAAIDRLIAGLQQFLGLPGNKPITVTTTYQTTGNPPPLNDDGTTYDKDGNPETPMARGGIVTGAKRIKFGEAGPELAAFIPAGGNANDRNKLQKMFGGGGGNVSVTFAPGSIVQRAGESGEAFSRRTVEEIQKRVRRLERA